MQFCIEDIIMSQPTGPLRQQPASSELANALGACRRAFYAIAHVQWHEQSFDAHQRAVHARGL